MDGRTIEGLSVDQVERLVDERRGWLIATLRSDGWAHEEAEDAVQEALLAAVRQRDEIHAFETAHLWALTVARRAAARLRKRHVQEDPVLPDTFDRHRASAVTDPIVRVDLMDALMALEGDDRVALVGRYEVGLSGVELAAALGRTHAATRTLVHRARNRFRSIYGTVLAIAPLSFPRLRDKLREAGATDAGSLAGLAVPAGKATLALVASASIVLSAPLVDPDGGAHPSPPAPRRPVVATVALSQLSSAAPATGAEGSRRRSTATSEEGPVPASRPVGDSAAVPTPAAHEEEEVLLGDEEDPIVARHESTPPDPWIAVGDDRDPVVVVYLPSEIDQTLGTPDPDPWAPQS